jgi:hypothetical protein
MIAQNLHTDLRSVSAGGLLHPTDLWYPVSFAMAGNYDSYGRVTVTDPDSWQVKTFIALLMSFISPVGEVNAPIFKPACGPGDITTIKAIQKLCLTGGGRIYVNSRKPEEKVKSQVGYMIVREDIYQAMIEGYSDYIGKITTPQSTFPEACEAIRSIIPSKSGRKKQIKDDLLYCGIGSYFDPMSGQLLCPFGTALNLQNYGALVQECLEPATKPTDPWIARILTEMLEFNAFDANMSSLRCTYDRQLSVGEDEDYALYQKIAQITLSVSRKRQTSDDD